MRQYPLIESAPYCCLAASLESLFKYHGYDNVTQFDIANYIGIFVFKEDRSSIPQSITNISVTTDPKMVGLHIYKETLNKLFEHFQLPFSETYLSWQEITDWNFENILRNIKPDEDAILYFDFGCLYGEEKNKGIGHTGLFVSIDENSNIEYLSSGPRFIGLDQHPVPDFVDAIKSRHGGLSIINSKRIYKTR